MAMSFRTKLLGSHVGLVVAVGLIAIFTLNRWLTEDLVRQLDTRLFEQAQGAVAMVREIGVDTDPAGAKEGTGRRRSPPRCAPGTSTTLLQPWPTRLRSAPRRDQADIS